MREARIILPRKGNNGETLTMVHAGLKRALCGAFGGFTAVSCEGGWMDKGHLYAESGVAYDVACDVTEEANQALRKIASHIAREAAQICVYLRLPCGEVLFVEPALAEA